MAQRVRIAAVGEVDEDLYLPEEESRLGGISVNFARAARWAGAEVAVYAAVGRDPRGEWLRARLAEVGLASRVRTLDGISASQRIRVDPDGERRFCGFEPGVLAGYRLDDAELAELDGFDAVAVPWSPDQAPLFEQIALATRTVRLVADFSEDSAAERSDPASWIAPHVAPGAARPLAVAFVGGRPAFLPALCALSRTTDTLVVLTVGAAGVFALRRGETTHQPSVARTVVDTTGCGDAFQGAFCARWLGGAPLEEALHAGARCAAIVAARRGAGMGSTEQ